MARGIIKFLKVREVKTPSRANPGDAGIDFYVPTLTDSYLKDFNEKNPDITIENDVIDDNANVYIIVKPHERVLMPSGIHCKMGENRCLMAFNKSGIASKHGLIVGACVDGETIIETNKGKFIAKDLTKKFINKNNILLKGYDEKTKTFNFYKFDGFRKTSEKHCIKFKFDNDEELICSEDHLLLTECGWKQAKDILLIDKLIQ